MARNGNGNGDRIPTIGDRGDECSYPAEGIDYGREYPSTFNLGLKGNLQAANFPIDPPVFNESPATRKSYAWNKGEAGNVD